MPLNEFTFHIEAKSVADILLETNDFVIASNYVELLGTRYEFPDS